MGSQGEIFGVSGPFQLTAIDWKNPLHRRAIAASLVQGAYNIEHDRQQNLKGPQAIAHPWWEFFGFKLNYVLVDDHDVSYFGAIYEYNRPHFQNSQLPGQTPPRYVIAFRGTLIKPGNRKQDLNLNLQFVCNNLHQSTRCDRAQEAVQNMVAMAGAGNVWLAGHSLGSAIALLIGRNMVAQGFHLETYLFNPPFDSPPIERIKHEKVKDGIRIASSFITAGFAAAVHSQRPNHNKKDPFTVLSEWFPYLFLNPYDPISCEYIGYFQHRDKMMSIGAGKIGQLATQHSKMSVMSSAVRGNDHEPIHLIPSAYLTINLSPTQDVKQAHGIDQWWKPDIHCDYKLYNYK